MDRGESSYKYAARRSHVLGITPHRSVKTLRLGIRHRRIGDHSRSESRVCTYPPEIGRSRFSVIGSIWVACGGSLILFGRDGVQV
jgi:hypothetical protein